MHSSLIDGGYWVTLHALYLFSIQKSTTIKRHIKLEVSDVSWIHTTNHKFKLATLTVVPSAFDFLNGLRKLFCSGSNKPAHILGHRLLLQDDNEYVIFFPSSHKLTCFSFLNKFMGEKKSQPSDFFSLSLTVKTSVVCFRRNTKSSLYFFNYINSLWDALLKEHKWSKFSYFCLPYFIRATGFLDSMGTTENRYVGICCCFFFKEKKSLFPFIIFLLSTWI